METPLQSLTDRYIAAQLAGDRATALQIMLEEGIGRGIPVSELYLNVIQPAQHRIGRLWQENRITVAQEHLATAISQLVLAHLYPLLPREPENGLVAVVACVPGELHDMGSRVAADFFEMSGYDVRFLGANVPVESLAAMVAETCADIVVLSVVMTFNLPGLREAVRAIRSAHGASPRIIVGGPAIESAPGLADELGIDLWGVSITDALAAARTLLASQPADLEAAG